MKKRVFKTNSVNLKAVMYIPGMDFMHTYSNSSIVIFNVLSIEAALVTIIKKLLGVIEFDGLYANYCYLILLGDLMTHRGMLMAITWHVINRAGTGTLMQCLSKETVEILMEAVAVSEKDDCHGIAEDVMLRQLAPMGTGGFNVALDINILKDAVVDHGLPIQNMLAAHTDGGMTPGQVAMMPYDTNSPAWSESNFKGKSVAFSTHSQRWHDPTNFSFLPHGQSPLGAGGMLPVSPGYSPSPPNAYSPHRPMSHIVCGCSLTIQYIADSMPPFYDRSQGATSPTYSAGGVSPTSPYVPQALYAGATSLFGMSPI